MRKREKERQGGRMISGKKRERGEMSKLDTEESAEVGGNSKEAVRRGREEIRNKK